MARSSKKTETPPSPATLVMFLTVLALVFVTAGGIGCCLMLYDSGHEDGLTNDEIIRAVSMLVGGTAIGCALWALAYLVRIQYDSASLMRHILSQLASRGGKTAGRSRKVSEEPADISPLPVSDASPAKALFQFETDVAREGPDEPPERGEISDVSALADEEEPAVAEPEPLVSVTAGPEEADDGIPVAEKADEDEDDPPEEAEAADEAEAGKDVAEDVVACRRQVEDLMALAHFDEAVAAAEELVESYPNSEKAADLWARVLRESDAYHRDMRHRMQKDVQHFSETRVWRRALAAAEKLIEAYPDSPEATQLSRQMQTLRDNSRIEEVRELRDQIRDMLERRRYAEAVKVAEEVMDRYPETQAAAELRGEIRRLRLLARGRARA